MKHKKVHYLVVCILVLFGNSKKVYSFTNERNGIDVCLQAFSEWKVGIIKLIFIQRN